MTRVKLWFLLMEWTKLAKKALILFITRLIHSLETFFVLTKQASAERNSFNVQISAQLTDIVAMEAANVYLNGLETIAANISQCENFIYLY